MDDVELSRCPWCGEAPTRIENEVKCTFEKCEVLPSIKSGSQDQADRIWNDMYINSEEFEDLNVTLSSRVGELDLSIRQLENDVEAQEITILELTNENEVLEKALDVQYSKMKNAYAREYWATRKINYDHVTYAPVTNTHLTQPTIDT